MASIVDTIYEIGYPLLYMPLHHVGGRVAKVAGCEYTGTPVATAIGSASPSNFTESVADFDGSTSRIELPNFGNLMTNVSDIAIACWVTFDALPGSFKRVVRIVSAGSTMFSVDQNGSAIDCFGRSAVGDSGANAVSSGALAIATNYCISGSVSTMKDSASVRFGASGHSSATGTMTNRSFANLDGISLFVCDDGSNGGLIDGIVHSLVIWDKCSVSETQHVALNSATTLGQWCNVALDSGGLFQIDGTTVANATGLHYSLTKGGPAGTLLAKGTDLSITAGIVQNEFYVPEASTNYWLNVNDSSDLTIGRGQQVTLTAVP